MEPNIQDRRKRAASPVPNYHGPDPHHHYSPELDNDHNLVHFNNGQSHSPGRRSGNRSSSSQWSRTSFKIGKAKPSKIRYLTREEIFGIGLALVLSFIFTSGMIALLIYGTPVAFEQLQYLSGQVREVFAGLRDANDTEVAAHTEPMQQTSRQPLNYAKDLSNQLNLLDDLTENAFKAKYYKQSPVLFTFPLCSDNKDIISSFLEQAENTNITVQSLDSYYISSKENHEIPSLKLGWKEFYDFQFSLNPPYSNHHYYACDQLLYSQLQPALQHSLLDLLFLSLPSLKSSYLTSVKEVCVGHADARFSGTSFHFTKERIHYLAQGEMHWILFPSTSDGIPSHGFNPLRNLQQWIEQLPHPPSSVLKLPTITHIIQKPGQFVYIPEGWYHASQTISDNPSISFIFEQKEPSSPTNYYYYFEEGNHRINEHDDYKGALRMYKMGLGIQRNVYLLEKLADVNVLLQNYLTAEELYREVMDLNPLNPIPYGKLIELLINYANKDISDSIASLLKQAEEKGIKEEVLTLANDHL